MIWMEGLMVTLVVYTAAAASLVDLRADPNGTGNP